MIVRRWRVLGPVALVWVLTVFAFPADSSAFNGIGIALTATGPSPSVLTMEAGLYPLWFNEDTVTHTVVFANGLCSFQVAPGEMGHCTDNPFSSLGEYPYTVDGTIPASIVVVADPPVTPATRAVTLTARSHRIGRGAHLMLHGRLTIVPQSGGSPGPPPVMPPQRVIVLARHDRNHLFRRIAVVRPSGNGSPFNWHLRVRPQKRMIYIAEANRPPTGGPWPRARSRPFKVTVSR